MNDTETIKSIIQALRCTAENADQRFTKCDEIDNEDCVGCPYRYEISGIDFDETSFSERTEKICDLAANAFESLIAEVERLNAELAAYENTGLESKEIQEAVNLFPWKDADIPAELKNWVERCTWHVKKCNELRKKLNAYQALGTVEDFKELVKIQNTTAPKMIYEVTYLCPPDAGGSEFDEYGYVPHCPNCRKKLDDYSKFNYCSNCGQKINWQFYNCPLKDGNDEHELKKCFERSLENGDNTERHNNDVGRGMG